ncbi:MAG: hypothetical protein WBO31_09130 [Saprospiraceae bacterium]
MPNPTLSEDQKRLNEIATHDRKINELKQKESSLKAETENLEKTKAKLSSDIEDFKKEITNVEADLKLWRTRYDYFTKDMAGISEDSARQRNKYLVGIGLCSVIILVIIWFLLFSMLHPPTLPVDIMSCLAGNSSLLFTAYIIMRISIIASLFIIIFIFINMIRGLISQFIRIQDRMTTIRLFDFLISKITSEKIQGGDPTAIEKLRIEKQVELLKQFLPALIETKESPFNGISQTKDAPEQVLKLLKGLKDLKFLQ